MSFKLNQDELSPNGDTITPVTLDTSSDLNHSTKIHRSLKLTLSRDIPPAYHTRPPPLVQPVKTSHFIDQTYEKYGLIDLAHEWVSVFRCITAPTMSAQDVAKSIKMCIPETVFLSPSGQPDVWYVTSASSFVKARTSTHVTSSSILEAFRCKMKSIVALGRRGFEVDFLTLSQLEKVCKDMEKNHFLTREKYFCLQKFIPRVQNKSFLVISNRSCAIPTSKTNPYFSSKRSPQYDLFLILHEENKPVKVQLKHINMEEKKKMKKIWMRFGFNEEILLPLLMRMRYLTSDIMNRVNKSVHTKKMVALACEFFIGAEDNVVYFSSFVGLQWENQKSTWEKLRHLDSISRAIYEYYSFFSIPSTHDDHEKKTSQQLVRNIDLLAFYDQMNPRFPSIQSSRIVETQWKCRSPLLAPDVSPRYFGAEMPKSYRKGHFYPLLTEKQSYTVNRLYLSPRGTYHSFECKQSSQPPLSPSRPDASGRGKILSSKIRADPQRSLKK